jgi:hypothetical protein
MNKKAENYFSALKKMIILLGLRKLKRVVTE